MRGLRGNATTTHGSDVWRNGIHIPLTESIVNHNEPSRVTWWGRGGKGSDAYQRPPGTSWLVSSLPALIILYIQWPSC